MISPLNHPTSGSLPGGLSESHALPDDRLLALSGLSAALEGYTPDLPSLSKADRATQELLEQALGSDLDLVFALELLEPSLVWLARFPDVVPYLIAWRALQVQVRQVKLDQHPESNTEAA